MKFLAIFLVGGLAFAQEPPIYVNNLSLEASQAMAKIAGRDPNGIKSEAELVEWARARLAWISLRRLQGQEKEALAIFEGCGQVCERYGSEREWAAARAWGCQKKREAKVCLPPSNPSDIKTKAQKPSR